MVHLGYGPVGQHSKNDYSLSSFHHEFRRERKPDFVKEETVGLLKALMRGRRDYIAKRRVADKARYAANSDGRTERRRERRAAESCEQRETRLARRRVADRARFAAISR